MSETLADRIRKCAEIVGSGDELARVTDIPRRTLESYLRGESEPKASRLVTIANAANVSVAWLVVGKMPMMGDEYDIAAKIQMGAKSNKIGLDEVPKDILGEVDTALNDYIKNKNIHLTFEERGWVLYEIAVSIFANRNLKLNDGIGWMIEVVKSRLRSKD